MIIQVNAGTVQNSDAIKTRAHDAVESALRHSADRVTRVEVHLHDENAQKSGPADKQCTMEARIAGQQPLAVDASSDDLYKAIDAAAEKLGRAVQHKLERLGSH